MLHEILLALMGHCGSIIVPVTVDEEIITNTDDIDTNMIVGFEVATGVAFIPDAEKVLLNGIVRMGYYYRCIERFIESHQSLRVSSVAYYSQNHGNDNNNDGGDDMRNARPGLYVRALCVGLDEFLDGYRAALLKTEQDILSEPHHQYPLAKLRVSLRDYAVILPHLKELIDEIHGVDAKHTATTTLHGGEILQRLYRRSLVGIPYVQACMKRLLFHCNSVLFHQISAWVVNGLVTDPYNEFFIEDTRENSSGLNDSITDDHVSVASTRTTASGSSGATSIGGFGNNTASVNWDVCFKLRLQMLATSYFPVALAKKILFVGKSVCILQHAQTQTVKAHIDIETGTATQKHAPLLPHTDALAFARAIHTLREKPSFDLLSVNQAVDAMRLCVNKHLWHLVVVEAKLYDHLKALKDFYLVGRGEFFQGFLEAMDTRKIFDLPPSQKVERDLNDGPFQLAAQQLNMDDDDDDDSGIGRLTVRLDKTSFTYAHFASRDVRKFGERGGDVVMVNGSATHMDRRIRLTASGDSQVGALWYDARKTVSRGFTTKFRFQLRQKPTTNAPQSSSGADEKDNQVLVRVRDGGGGRGAGASSTPSKRSLPWSWGEGLSFVVQNFSILASPVVARADITVRRTRGRHHHHSGGGDGSSSRIGRLSPDSRVTVTNENAEITGIALDRHTGEPVVCEGVANSIEVYMHISPSDPASNHVCVYTRSQRHHDNDSEYSRLLAHSHARQQVDDDDDVRVSTAPLAHMSDGREHVVHIVYGSPTQHQSGVLTVYVDDLSTPVLVYELDIESYITLDDGRAYVGFTAVNGYTPLEPTRRERHTVTSHTEYSRDLVSWEFSESDSVSARAWRTMRLSYRLEPPLDLLLMNEDFDRYNALFSFLFLTKRAQLKLQSTWPLLMHINRAHTSIITNHHHLFRTITTLRHKMQFFIDNLQYYLQVDVLEVEYTNLLQCIRDSTDFETVCDAHRRYVNRLMMLCFRGNVRISRCLDRIFDIILEYCMIVERYASAHNITQDDEHSLSLRMDDITRVFERQTGFMFSILGPQSSYYSAPHLAQLVLRLDYNRFFSDRLASYRHGDDG